MGWFTTKLPAREGDWRPISLRLKEGLQVARTQWYAMALRELPGSPWIVNPVLGGSADLILRAHQLEVCVEKIATEGYIAVEDGRYFADILFAVVGGGELPELMEIFRKQVLVSERAEKLLKLGQVVSEFMLGKPTGTTHTPRVAMIANALTVTSALAAANAFGDAREARRLAELVSAMGAGRSSL